MKGQSLKTTISLDENEDEGLALLIPDIQETTTLVQSKTVYDENIKEEASHNILDTGVSPGISIEHTYLEAMKKLQFGKLMCNYYTVEFLKFIFLKKYIHCFSCAFIASVCNHDLRTQEQRRYSKFLQKFYDLMLEEGRIIYMIRKYKFKCLKFIKIRKKIINSGRIEHIFPYDRSACHNHINYHTNIQIIILMLSNKNFLKNT